LALLPPPYQLNSVLTLLSSLMRFIASAISGASLSPLNERFLLFTTAGAVAQILGTVALLAAMQARNAAAMGRAGVALVKAPDLLFQVYPLNLRPEFGSACVKCRM
jgi:hypothetical protein